MIVAWMSYALVAGFVLTLAALAAEPLGKRKRRLVWAAALFASFAVPLALPFIMPRNAIGEIRSVAASDAASPPPATAGSDRLPAGNIAAFSRTDNIVAAAWLAASLALITMLLAAHRRSIRDARGWRHGEVEREPALLSDDFGPAVVGFFPPRIVVPQWALALGADELRLIVRHEREHVRAHDQHLLFAALGAVVVMPWNIALWVQLARLRAAIELDCDARVACGGVNPSRYASVLVAASERQGPRPAAALALLHPVSSLMRRVDALTARRRLSPSRATARVAASLGCVLLAGVVPPPAAVTSAVQVMLAPSPKGTLKAPSASDITANAGEIRGRQLAVAPAAPRDPAAVRATADRALRARTVSGRTLPNRPLRLATGALGLNREPPQATDALRQLKPAAPPAVTVNRLGGFVGTGGGGGAGARATMMPVGAAAGAIPRRDSSAAPRPTGGAGGVGSFGIIQSGGTVMAVPRATTAPGDSVSTIRRVRPDSAAPTRRPQ